MAKNLKISFLSFYSGIVSRGVETFVHELSNRLIELGNEVCVYQNGPTSRLAKYKSVDVGVRFEKYVDSKYAAVKNSLLIKSFTHKALRLMDPHTQVVFPTNGQWQSLYCSIWARTHHQKIVISGQSGPGLDDRINLWTFPDSFIALTDHQAHWAQKVNPFVRVNKTPNGVDLNKFMPKKKQENLILKPPIVLNVSALVNYKRIDLCIKAVSLLKDVSLLIIGKGEDESKLQSMAEQLMPGRFKIISAPYDQIPQYYNQVDIFTYPTVPWESFGIVLLEAMASGLPVVATDDPIRREIVAKAGLFVDPTDTLAYSRALSTALGQKWGNIPRQQAEKFSWDLVADKYFKLFNILVNEK